MLSFFMSSTLETLARLRKLTQSMNPKTASVDEALPAARALFAAAHLPFKLVGGIAVVHHGYSRSTEDIDVLVSADGHARLDAVLTTHGFERESRSRLRHRKTGVRIDLIVAGEHGPRPDAPPYPSPESVTPSATDADVVGLAPLLMLKLRARRYQNLADVVALLKLVDDAHFVALEAELPADLRGTLSDLRRDAKEELALQGD